MPRGGKAGNGNARERDHVELVRKVALPSINMNNPHNMWTDRSQRLIYQTAWFDSKLTLNPKDQNARSYRNHSVVHDVIVRRVRTAHA